MRTKKGKLQMEIEDILNEAEIRSYLPTKVMGRNVQYYEQIDSTNNQLREQAQEGAPEGTLLVADCQNSGRGRRGRTWSSPPGTSLSYSLLLRPRLTPDAAPMLTLLMALAVADTLEDMRIEGGRIKWPNDVIINGKKICGILTEMDATVDEVHNVVIGVGINVHMTEFPHELENRATSIYQETGRHISRAELTAGIMGHFEELYEEFLDKKDLTFVREAYNSRLVNVEQQVQVLEPGDTYAGVAQGINDKGELLVKLETGEIHRVYAGEVSVRGVYGYV